MKLTPTHLKACDLLASGMSNMEVSKEINTAPETVSRWKNDFDFAARYNGILNARQTAAEEGLRELSAIAIDTIKSIMTDTEAPSRERLAAALKIIEVNKLRPARMQSSNPVELEEEKKRDELLGDYGF